MAETRTGWRTWTGLVLLGALGIVLDPLGHPIEASFLFIPTVAWLVARAIVRSEAATSVPRMLMMLPGSIGLLGGLQGFKYGGWAGTPEAAVVCALGYQLFLLALAAGSTMGRSGRRFILLLGHALAIVGSYDALTGGLSAFVAAAYLVALVLLSLDGYWAHRGVRSAGTLRSWEAPYLMLVGGGGLALLVSPIQVPGAAFVVALVGLKTGLLVSLALVAGPPHLPDSLRARPGGVVEFVTQALGLVMVLNAGLFLIIFRIPELGLPFFIAMTCWLVVAVLAEYVALMSRRRGDVNGVHGTFDVVIAACNEERHIAATIEAARGLPGAQEVIVVVAARSSDGTADAVRGAAKHLHGVTYVAGTGGTKAEDLCQAWPLVRQEIGLILDADERVRADTLRHALAIMEKHPNVGIVQGRKAAPTPTWTARFAAIERKFSTLYDHTMQDRRFGAAHFGGSAALVRRPVPEAAGWWSPSSLTEDIEFAVRVHTYTPWDIRYEPRFEVLEDPVRDGRALLRQRGRWARGWNQVARLHFAPLMGSKMTGFRVKVGLGWQLATAVSAPWTAVFPTLLFLVLWDRGVFVPPLVGLALGILILPSRLVTFGVPYFRDPLFPVRPRPERLLAVAAGAYLWVPVGWMLQLQALYLELSSAPKVWHATRV